MNCAAMADGTRRWTLEDLVDFEAALAGGAKVPPTAADAAVAAARGMEGTEARRAGLRAWLEVAREAGAAGKPGAGRRFRSGLALAALLVGTLAFLAGVSAAAGMFRPSRGGIDVTLFLAVLLGGQWLFLLLAGMAWLLRGRAAEGFSTFQAALGKLARRFAGDAGGWWSPAMESRMRTVLLWRFARMAQGAGVAFNLGILASLGFFILLRHVGFFWETTTESALRSGLETAVRALSAPWAAWWPESVPRAETIAATRWLPATNPATAPGASEWWRFLLMAVAVWGLGPRFLLWLAAGAAGRRALRAVDFQARHHRQLWRDLTGPRRADLDEKPLDGVLVLDVGGSNVNREALRPFLLRRLRANPAAWKPVAVLDPGAEREAERALAVAPAGVVFFAEGWSLSPPRMNALHTQVRQAAGPDVPVKFLVANVAGDGQPEEPAAEERAEWERFADALRDPAAEVYFYSDAG